MTTSNIHNKHYYPDWLKRFNNITSEETVSTGKMIIYTLTGALLLLAFFLKLIPLFFQIKDPQWSFMYGEFLINFEGGFVRRGILGQCLYYYTLFTENDPSPIISSITLLAFIFVLYFFIREFNKKGYNWWFIFSVLCVGMMSSIIRRDFMLYSLMILSYYSWNKIDDDSLKSCLITLYCILGLLIHEAYIFFGVPVMMLLIFSSKTKLLIKITMPALIIITFGLLSYYKGDRPTSEKIITSWLLAYPEIGISSVQESGGMESLCWETISTFIFHLHKNFIDPNISNSALRFYPIPLRIIFFIVYYYFVTNFFRVFKYRSSFDQEDYRNLSALLLFSLFCLLPMFTVLSCDYGRLYQYATMATLIPFLILPKLQLSKIFPKFYLRLIDRINSPLKRLGKPKLLFIFMLLFIAVSPTYWDPSTAFFESVIGKPIGSAIYFISKYAS